MLAATSEGHPLQPIENKPSVRKFGGCHNCCLKIARADIPGNWEICSRNGSAVPVWDLFRS
jgi:hypothetical protein